MNGNDPYPEREATAAEAQRLKAAGWKLTVLGTLWIVPSAEAETKLRQRFFSTDEALETLLFEQPIR